MRCGKHEEVLPGDGPFCNLGLLDDDETILSQSRDRTGGGNGGQEDTDGNNLLGEHLGRCSADWLLVPCLARVSRDDPELTG